MISADVTADVKQQEIKELVAVSYTSAFKTWNMYFSFKGKLIQIWKSPYLFKLI